MITAWGGWTLFQELLTVLKNIAIQYSVSVSNVACRWVLQQPAVGSVIIGARLGISSNIKDNAKIFTFELSQTDLGQIDEILAKSFVSDTDCGDEYR